ncbi:MAG: Rieske (2Fe-2S) protein [Candidatus Saccharibacteria bacterium]|nr:Rieske (2Fe-2S) protein [Moraxellaceae bacterium]
MSGSAIAESSAIVEGQLFSAKVNNESVIVTRVNNELKAYSAKCPHMGLPLSVGKVENGTVTCKFHGAEFDLATGNNIKWVDSFFGLSLPKFTHNMLAMGKKPCGLKHYNVSEQDGQVFLSVQT